MGPSPKHSDSSELYQGESGRKYHEVKRFIVPVALPWVIASRARKLQRHIKPSDVVFEFGAGAGWNLAGLRCARKLGSDAAGFLKKHIEASGAEFFGDSSELPPASVDVALLHHSLEHMLHPPQVLAEAGRILKPSGKLLVYVPWERERRYRLHNPAEPNHHLYSWNAQTLGNLIGICGFEPGPIRVLKYGYDRFAANTAARSHTGEVGFRLIRRTLLMIKPLREVEAVAFLKDSSGR